METLDHAERGRCVETPEALARIPMRKLVLATALASLIAQALSRLGDVGGNADAGPWDIVVGQAVWNAAQVGLLLLLLCLWAVRRRWWVAAVAIVTLVALPFAIYAISPGGWAFSAILLATCALTWAGHAPDLDVAFVDAPSRGTPMLAKFEFLAFTCNLLCSMYNYLPSWRLFPHWAFLFEGVRVLIGFTLTPAALAQSMYSLGLDGVSLPAYIHVGFSAIPIGAAVFSVIWTDLPFLYVLYFAALAKQAKNTPGTRLQQALCFVCIFHFLFLTDLVDYQYGRGVANPAADWCHWLEVFVWRIAILLPIYQKLATGQWRRGNGAVGGVLHYGMAVWAAGFFVYEVLMYNVPSFLTKFGFENRPLRLCGRGYSEKLGWHGALLLMILLYGFMVLAMRCKRVIARPVTSRLES